MKKIYLIVCIIAALLLSNNANAQQLKVLNQSKSSLSIELTIDNYKIKEIPDGDEVFHEIALSSIMIPNDKGKPNLPSVNRFVALPQGAKANVIVESYEKEILKNINIAPSKGIVSEYELTDEHFSKDRNIYSKDELYPNHIVSLTEQMNLRGVDAVGLSIAPVQFNPVSKELIVYKKIKFRVEFEGGNGMFGDNRLRSQYWDPILQHNILNYNNIPEVDYARRMERWIADDAEGAEYLIIIPDNESFREQAQRLADYRSKQGIITKVFSLSDMNATDENDMKEWLEEAYNNWEIAPVAVCLIGDYNSDTKIGVPSFIFEYEEAQDPDFKYASDFVMTDFNDDLYAELCISRLCSDNVEEAKLLIDKIIGYEFTNPTMDDDFYKRPITTCAYQQSKWFQICTESIGGYLRSKGKDPNRVNTIYEHESNYDENNWSSATNTEQIVEYFGPNGLGYIPATPGELGGFYNDYDGASTYRITDAINQGAYVVQHRDHGWTTLWGSPWLPIDSLHLLNNENKLPLILSVNCASGKFNNANCLAEEFMKMDNKGAIAVIAPTCQTHSYTNDSYTWGVWDFFENDFLPDYGTSTANNNNYMPAFANVSAKYFLLQQNFPNTYQNSRELTNRTFHAHCDAFLKIYSEVPQQMSVEHDEHYNYDSRTFNIKAPQGSTICISAEGLDGIKIANTTEGTGNYQTISLSEIATPEKIIRLTVTKNNHLRYETTISAHTENAFVKMNDFNFYDDIQYLIFNNNTSIDLELKNIGLKNSSSVNMSLICNSEKIHITNHNNTFEGISVNEIININDAFDISIDDGIINDTKLLFTLTIEHDGISHQEKFFVNVKAPIFKITDIYSEDDDGNINNNITDGKYFKVKAKIMNNGEVSSNSCIVYLTSNDGIINIITEEISLEPIESNSYKDIEFEVFATEAVNDALSSSLNIEVSSGAYKETIEYICYHHLIIDSFENGTINNTWDKNRWSINSNLEERIGNYCVMTGNTNDSFMETEYEVPFDGIITFYFKVASKRYVLDFYIDDERVSRIVGDNIWKSHQRNVTQGLHKFKWVYSINPAYSAPGEAGAYLDHIYLKKGGLDIQENNIDDIVNIYPNPTDDFVNIEVENGKEKAKSIEIINDLGITVISTKFKNKINVSSLSPGLYLIRINFEDYNYTNRIVIE